MGSFPTGITVITAEREGGQVHGMTANSLTSVSLEPLLILVCVDQNARLLSYLKAQRRFGVNILKNTQRQSLNCLPNPSQMPTKSDVWEYASGGRERAFLCWRRRWHISGAMWWRNICRETTRFL